MTILKPLLAGILLIATACNNSTEKTVTAGTGDTTVISVTSAAPDSSLSGCYSLIVKRDTATLQLQTKGINITGPLTYNFYEKDRNDGTFQGEVKDNVLTGWYIFRSEGVVSVRQVIWKINNDKLLPATGDMIQRGDTLLFSEPDKLKYDSTGAFMKVPCVI